MVFGAGSETLGYFALQSFWGTEVVSVQFSIAQRGSEAQKILTGDLVFMGKPPPAEQGSSCSDTELQPLQKCTWRKSSQPQNILIEIVLCDPLQG